jgi:hypothetical protein
MARKTPGDDSAQKRRRSKPKNKEPEETPPPLTAEEFEQAFKQYCSEKGAVLTSSPAQAGAPVLSAAEPPLVTTRNVELLLGGSRRARPRPGQCPCEY